MQGKIECVSSLIIIDNSIDLFFIVYDFLYIHECHFDISVNSLAPGRYESNLNFFSNPYQG